jgi:hypothetical protein
MSKRISHSSYFTHTKKIIPDLCTHVCSLHGIKTLADPDSWNRDPDPHPDIVQVRVLMTKSDKIHFFKIGSNALEKTSSCSEFETVKQKFVSLLQNKKNLISRKKSKKDLDT